MVADESPLKLFFRPDELELIICGSHVISVVCRNGLWMIYRCARTLTLKCWKHQHNTTEDSLAILQL